MFDLEAIVRPNILKLKPYASARDEFEGHAEVFLDANENPYGSWNRYPDPHQQALKARIAALKGVGMENIFVGNGSDEAIDLLFRIFCRPDLDKVMTFPPTYGMYEVTANIHGAGLIQIPLDADFQPDITKIAAHLPDPALKLIFVCSPNNPSGNTAPPELFELLRKEFRGIVVVDEAYIDFAQSPSLLKQLPYFPNFVVLQTFSKAWGMAALRCGMAFAQPPLIDLMNKVKAPYNVSRANQELVLEASQDPARTAAEVLRICAAREEMAAALQKLPAILQVYPSEANFLLVRVQDANEVYRQLAAAGIVVRNRHSVAPGCLRITIGTAEENARLFTALQSLPA